MQRPGNFGGLLRTRTFHGKDSKVYFKDVEPLAAFIEKAPTYARADWHAAQGAVYMSPRRKDEDSEEFNVAFRKWLEGLEQRVPKAQALTEELSAF